MAVKRSIVDNEQSNPADERKRARRSPSAAAQSDSSTTSRRSISEDTAMNSIPDTVMHGQEISVRSVPSHGNPDASDSSTESSEDSASSTAGGDDEEAEDDDERSTVLDPVVTLGGPKKPAMDAGVLAGASDLASRLKAFLPQLQQANSKLAERGTGLNMEEVDDDEEHIEMSLGLGVLEQKKPEDLADLLHRKANKQDETSDTPNHESEDEPDVLEKLMNMEREVAKADQPSIEEVECRPNDSKASDMSKTQSEEQRADLALRQSRPSRPS